MTVGQTLLLLGISLSLSIYLISSLNDDLAYNTFIICNGFVHCSYAKPWMDLDTGNSFCLFFPYSPEHLVRTIPKLKAVVLADYYLP